MLERNGYAQHPQRPEPAQECQAATHRALDPLDRVVAAVEMRVQARVLARVNRFLRDERPHIVRELALRPTPKRAHRIDEQPLAVGKRE